MLVTLQTLYIMLDPITKSQFSRHQVFHSSTQHHHLPERHHYLANYGKIEALGAMFQRFQYGVTSHPGAA